MYTQEAWYLGAVVWSFFARQIRYEADLHLGDTQFESRSRNRLS